MNVLFRFTLLAIFTLGLNGCNDSWTWHQKITVSVSTPEGIKTASSVMKARLAVKGGWWAPPEATGVVTSLSGESVVLEVVPGKHLFALLKGTPHAYTVFFPDEAPLAIANKLPGMRKARELLPRQYPLLVAFGDITNPASVKRVDPARLDDAFGAGYRLESIVLTITDEPVTAGPLLEILPWLGPYPETPLLSMVRPEDFSFEAKLRQGNFIRR